MGSLRKIAAVVALLCICATQSLGQTPGVFPSRPIKIIVPYAPGGNNDTLARLIGKVMQETLGQPVIIENRPGASTTIGAGAVAGSEPDGYTLLYTASLAVNELLYASTNRKTKDFAPIISVATLPMVVYTHPTIPNDLKELIAYAKANPNKLSYPTFGPGSIPHLACSLFSSAVGIEITGVPYRGGGPALQDVLRGELQLSCDNLGAIQYIENGQVKPVGIMARRRVSNAPQIATFAELGYPDVLGSISHGMYAPAGTPAAIVQTLNAVVNNALKDPTVFQRIRLVGGNVEGGGPEALLGVIEEERVQWGRVIKALNLNIAP